MCLECGRKPTQAKGEHAKSTQEGPNVVATCRVETALIFFSVYTQSHLDRLRTNHTTDSWAVSWPSVGQVCHHLEGRILRNKRYKFSILLKVLCLNLAAAHRDSWYALTTWSLASAAKRENDETCSQANVIVSQAQVKKSSHIKVVTAVWWLLENTCVNRSDMKQQYWIMNYYELSYIASIDSCF